MPRAPSTFRQQDVSKAIRAALAAGVGIARIEIAADGRIVLIVSNDEHAAEPREANEWDRA